MRATARFNQNHTKRNSRYKLIATIDESISTGNWVHGLDHALSKARRGHQKERILRPPFREHTCAATVMSVLVRPYRRGGVHYQRPGLSG
jgi:hypothetical protein